MKHSINIYSSKLLRKRYHKTLGTSVINSPLFPLSIWIVLLEQVDSSTPIYPTEEMQCRGASSNKSVNIFDILIRIQHSIWDRQNYFKIKKLDVFFKSSLDVLPLQCPKFSTNFFLFYHHWGCKSITTQCLIPKGPWSLVDLIGKPFLGSYQTHKHIKLLCEEFITLSQRGRAGLVQRHDIF